jgi:hypothetical protein
MIDDRVTVPYESETPSPLFEFHISHQLPWEARRAAYLVTHWIKSFYMDQYADFMDPSKVDAPDRAERYLILILLAARCDEIMPAVPL